MVKKYNIVTVRKKATAICRDLYYFQKCTYIYIPVAMSHAPFTF